MNAQPQPIFVFGSNLSGIHGAGAARIANRDHGAVWGIGEGLMGQSYALPTKGFNISFMPMKKVQTHIENFLAFARVNPNKEFKVTRIGCGLAGFKDEDIAAFFKEAPSNCTFDLAWHPYLGKDARYWGTF